MKFSNFLKIDTAIYDYIVEKYKPFRDDNTIHVTQLIDSPKIYFMMKKYSNKITVDVSTLLATVLGNAVHQVLQKKQTTYNLKKEIDGVTVTGECDYYENGCLVDYKVTSMWTVFYSSRKENWVKQLSVYKYLLEERGLPVNNAKILAICRDFIGGKIDSIIHPFQDIFLQLWSNKKTEKFLNERIKLFKSLADVEPEKMVCEDNWKGKRCQNYCMFRPFCEMANGKKGE
jgi:hypothetical protein